MKLRTKNKDSGFTLVELIIVITILAILVGIATPNVVRYLGKAKISKCISAQETLKDEFACEYLLNREKPKGEQKSNDLILQEVFSEHGVTVSGGKVKGICPEGGTYTVYVSKDNQLRVHCDLAGHSSSTFKMEVESISDGLASYTSSILSSWTDTYIDEWVKNNGGTGYKMSDEDIQEVFGSYAEALDGEPENLYLKPLGAAVYDENGKPKFLNIQMITSVPGIVNSASDMLTYGLIVDGTTYVMKKNGVIYGSSLIGRNGPTLLDRVAYNNKVDKKNNVVSEKNRYYKNIEEFIIEITKTTRSVPYQKL